MCNECLAVAPRIVQLVGTSAALLCGQRYLFDVGDGSGRKKWARRVTLAITLLVSFAINFLGAILLILSLNDDYRTRNFANICIRQSLMSTPLDEHRCSILREGNVAGRVLEFGSGPGSNFKCLENYTDAELGSIEKYVAVEPNLYFEEEMRKQHAEKGFDKHFPLEFVGVRGEDAGSLAGSKDRYYEEGSFDVVIFTHVLCSVDSIEDVLSNAKRALKPGGGGRIVFMEHVSAPEGTMKRYVQRFMAPGLHVIANGCTIQNIGEELRRHLGGDGGGFDIRIEEFEAPMPWFMSFVSPHIKGVATKV